MTALRAFVVTALAALFILLSSAIFANPPTLYTGIHFNRTSALVQRNVIEGVDRASPAYRAGLRSGDILSCLSVQDRWLLFPIFHAAPAYVAGTPIRFCVRHGDAWRNIQLIADPRPPAGYLYGSLAIATLRFAVFLVFVVCGVALALGRPGVMSFAFFAYCLGNLPVVVLVKWTALAPALASLAIALGNSTNAVGVSFLLLFVLLIPEGRLSGWRTPAYRIALIVTGCFAALVVFVQVRTDIFATWILNDIDVVLTSISVLIVLARLLSIHGEERSRFSWAAFAVIWGVVTNDLRNVLPLSAPTIVIAVLTVVMPLSLMYAILKRHIIDVRFVISRTVVYTTITTFVVGIIGVVDWATSTFLAQRRIAMALDALVTIALAFLLKSTYAWIESAVDSVLFRKKYEAEAYLNRLAKTLLRANREETVDRAIVHDPYEKFELTMAALFRAEGGSFAISCAAGWDTVNVPPFDCDHDLIRFLATERARVHIHDLRRHVAAQFIEHGHVPAVAIPLFAGDELAAFAIYGIHRSGTNLDPDEVETLERLSESAAQAYVLIENSRYRAALSKKGSERV